MRCLLDRRELLGGLASMAVGCGDSTSTKGADARPDQSATPDDAGADGCTTTCTMDENTLVLPFDMYPELQNAGGSKVVQDPRYSDPVCKMQMVFVARISVQGADGQFVALAAACTHECCTVKLSGNSTLQCPCHGSLFNLSGKVTRGPATKPLQSLPVCADDCAIYVQLK